MASEKVTDLTNKTTVLTTDTYHVVDTTDTSQDPAGSSYKITWATLKAAILGYFSGGTGITYSGGVISVDPTATMTMTNKTLTSPTINGGTISGATLSSITLGTPLPLTSGGTGASTQNAAAAAILPSMSGNSGKYLTNDGASTASWTNVDPQTTFVPGSLIAGQALSAGKALCIQSKSSVAVTLDNKGSFTGTGVSVSGSFTVGSNTNRGLVVFVQSLNNSSNVPTNVTYNGTSCTKIANTGDGTYVGDNLSVWYLNAPATGTNSLNVINPGSSDNVVFLAYSYYNVSQSGQPEANTTGSTSNLGGSLSAQLNTLTNGSLVVAAAYGNALSGFGGNVYGNNILTFVNMTAADSGSLFPPQLATFSATSTSSFSGAVAVSLAPVISSNTFAYYQTTATSSLSITPIGFALNSVAAGATPTIITGGVLTGQTLTPGAAYYLSDTSGGISNVVGTNTRKVGTAIDASTLLITTLG